MKNVDLKKWQLRIIKSLNTIIENNDEVFLKQRKVKNTKRSSQAENSTYLLLENSEFANSILPELKIDSRLTGAVC